MPKYTAQKKDGSPKQPWSIAEDGRTCVDTSKPWATTTYRTRRDAQNAIDAHADVPPFDDPDLVADIEAIDARKALTIGTRVKFSTPWLDTFLGNATEAEVYAYTHMVGTVVGRPSDDPQFRVRVRWDATYVAGPEHEEDGTSLHTAYELRAVDDERIGTDHADDDAARLQQYLREQFPGGEVFYFVPVLNDPGQPLGDDPQRVGEALDDLIDRGIVQDEGVSDPDGGSYRLREDAPSLADEDTPDEMLTILPLRDGEVYDGASVIRVESGATVGVFLTVQTYQQVLRYFKAVRTSRDALDLIPRDL